VGVHTNPNLCAGVPKCSMALPLPLLLPLFLDADVISEDSARVFSGGANRWLVRDTRLAQMSLNTDWEYYGAVDRFLKVGWERGERAGAFAPVWSADTDGCLVFYLLVLFHRRNFVVVGVFGGLLEEARAKRL